MTLAFMFSGQGAQYTGMGQDLLAAYPELTSYFDRASQVVGYDMQDLCFNQTEKIHLTEYTQPAILTVSTAIHHLLDQAGIEADYLAGLSLGEYSALVAAGVLDFDQAVRIVQNRGRFMAHAVPNGVGKMVAVMNADRDLIEEICAACRDQLGSYVAPANYNTPKQIVIGGDNQAVDLACEKLQAAGVRKLIPLQVSGPFHTALLAPAAQELADYIADEDFKPLAKPVISNTTARPHTDQDLKARLADQVMMGVRWQDSIDYLIDQGVDTFVELGPGKTLMKFMKQIDKSVQAYHVEDVASLEKTLAALKGD
ncbi:ACP S-malonyltransferase [Aerococcus urinaehominis]|uniref:Malonyl CoA-acyl carrier protein transacylase n=1 Tax=Aerococcus urinaehominis TaxID=128944 RepID=A0A0X8FJJ9_9LACT|nr:ACP S-malonyltransferase [Aerococcus urinaehominis]AMB98492.1 ACP S-malonyltransferase [Aerococcus urinaehominis]SDL80912.1 [acyl-carrier-protein] S-malonyltransferase [Aerococcus urinaehominis]